MDSPTDLNSYSTIFLSFVGTVHASKVFMTTIVLLSSACVLSGILFIVRELRIAPEAYEGAKGLRIKNCPVQESAMKAEHEEMLGSSHLAHRSIG
jgi:hypothetical protein